jgi:tetratricopeptide (TPR) repeat protein
MTIPQGTQFGPYKILELIGSGGMGEVYRALDTRLEREVALKLVSDSYLASEIGSGSPSPVAGTPHTRGHLSHERFLREARSAATLSHPNICAIFDTGEQDGRPYLVMELLRGETLKQYLVRSGVERPLSPDEVIAFSQQAASALSVAHAAGIVHRDIKPANLFVSQAAHGRKQIKILDFGLAKKQGTDASPDSRAVSAAGIGPATGDEIASEQATATDKDHVLPVLGTAAASMRAKLGEDLASIAKLNTPFGQATTPSLEAFRAYALGDVAHGKALNIPEAEGHYLHAVELDPNFAMAYARLGAIYGNAGMQAKQNEYFTKAYELSSHVSEVERLYIAGHYYEGVTGNIPKTIETLQESIQTYPAQDDAYVNINVAYQTIGQDEAGLPYAQKAAAMYPDDAITSSNLLTDYLALNRWAEARAEMERAHQLGMDASTDVAATFLWGYFLLGEPQQVQRLVAGVSGRPDEFVVTAMLGVTQQFSGQYRLANATFQRAFEQAGRAKAPDAQASFLLTEAAGRGLAGLCDDNEAIVKKALALDKSVSTLEGAALTAAFCGNGKMALPMAEELSRKRPDDTLVQNACLPLTKAFVALAEKRWQDAIHAADPAKSGDVNFPASYAQGLAWLELHDAASAVNAFKAATRSRMDGVGQVGLGVPYYAQAQLGLARAYLMAGDKANAKKSYEAFFTTWKDADSDLPMLISAKKEYAAL